MFNKTLHLNSSLGYMIRHRTTIDTGIQLKTQSTGVHVTVDT